MLDRRTFVALGAAALTTTPTRAEWPGGGTLSFVVPFPPGGGVDQMARLIQPFLQKQIPETAIVIDNRPGAGSQIGMEHAFGAAPDGATICGITSPAMMTLPFERKVRYRVADFVYIANIIEDPCAVWVRKDSPFRSVEDLLKKAKEAPGGVSVATSGVGSDDHLLLLLIEGVMTGATFNHVLFNGSSPMVTAMLGGHVDAACFNVGEGATVNKDGIVRCLGQASATRWPRLADVPTLAGQGVKASLAAQRGVVAPPGLPDALRDRLGAAFKAAMDDPAFKEHVAKLQLPVRGLYGEEYRQSVLGLDAQLQDMWKRKPWKAGAAWRW